MTTMSDGREVEFTRIDNGLGSPSAGIWKAETTVQVESTDPYDAVISAYGTSLPDVLARLYRKLGKLEVA